MLRRLLAAGLLVIGMASACPGQDLPSPLPEPSAVLTAEAGALSVPPNPDSWKALESSEPEQGVRLLPSRNEGASIERLFLHLRNPSGDPDLNRRYREQIVRAFQIRAGGSSASSSPIWRCGACNSFPLSRRRSLRFFSGRTKAG